MTTITANSTVGIYLTSPSYTSPLVINPGVSISGYAGVDLVSGGTVSNAASALITGVIEGVGISGGAGTMVSYGNIAGTGIGGIGVILDSGGSITNAAAASISGTVEPIGAPFIAIRR
jgi:hypothetical protein